MVGCSPTRHQSAETAHPLRGGVAKPRVSPQWEDCRVTEQVRCPVTGMEWRRIAINGITAVTDRSDRACPPAPLELVPLRSKGGEALKEKNGNVPLGNEGRLRPPLFLIP